MAEPDFIQQNVPPLPPRYRFRDLIRGDHATGAHAGGDVQHAHQHHPQDDR